MKIGLDVIGHINVVKETSKPGQQTRGDSLWTSHYVQDVFAALELQMHGLCTR